MKAVRYLVPMLAATAICAFGVLAADKRLPLTNESAPVSNESVPVPKARTNVGPVALPASPMRETLDEIPELVRWLLEVTATKGDVEQASAHQALSALAPIATAELIKELDNKNIKVRIAAMSCLAGCATSQNFPQKDVLAKLLKIAQNEKEDEDIRRLATLAICQIICATQGSPLSISF